MRSEHAPCTTDDRPGSTGYEARHAPFTGGGNISPDRFADRIDKIRAHCIARVDKHMHSNQWPAIRQLEQTQLEITHPASPTAQSRVHRIGGIQQCWLSLFKRCDRIVGVGNVCDVNLADQQRTVIFDLEAALQTVPSQPHCSSQQQLMVPRRQAARGISAR